MTDTLSTDIHHLDGPHIGCGFEFPRYWDEDLSKVTCKGCIKRAEQPEPPW